MDTPLAELIPSWSIPRLRQTLAFAGDSLSAEDRAAIEDTLRERDGDLPPDPAASGLLVELAGWTTDELRAAYLDPHDPYDWRQRGAIEHELASRTEVRPLGLDEEFAVGANVVRTLSAGSNALGSRTGAMLGRTFLLGFCWIGLILALGGLLQSLRGVGVAENLLIPLYFVASAAVLVWIHYDLARLGLSAVRGTVASRGHRVDRLGAWVTYGLLWLVLLGLALLLAVIEPWLLAALSLPLLGLAQGVAVCAQLLQAERKLTPLAALHAVALGVRAHPIRWLWLGTCWGFLWGVCMLVFVVPLCGICIAPFVLWVMFPISAGAWAHVYAAFSGAFPPLAKAPGRWSFPGAPVPGWVLPAAALLLTVSLWACSGGAVLVGDVAENVGMAERWVEGFAPMAALGGVAVVPVLITLGLLSLARRKAGGVVVDEEGLRLDVTGRWQGRHVPWARVRGYRLSEQGLRFQLIRRPWTQWTGPLVPARDREAHELVAQLEAWGVRRDGA